MNATNPEDDLALSRSIEDLLVSRNLRGMRDVQSALTPGYYMRAAKLLLACKGTVLIGTGFPVLNSFETDGPIGAIALYKTLEYLGAKPIIVCCAPMSTAIAADFRVHEIAVGELANAEAEAQLALDQLQPELVLSIERAGLSEQGIYCNMRGEDISDRCASFDYFLKLASYPTIAIGDGGNEVGMGNIYEAIKTLDITPSVTTCDELVIADVSNWAAHGLIAMLSYWQQEDLLARINPQKFLEYIAERGSLDGVTREPTLTEDSLPLSEGQKLITQLRQLVGFSD
ncbi:MAG: DUF4392 domain-containing protein [Oceanicoccus sp.]|uniref:DUF4392 domain-containing protein n=1 Tax=Oceanicoccus sp. TaxID=2691044 RepID=UPI00262408F5|nr:glutamate cyclase domain-containing protein [Oceanicoccus sp.]MCP3908026.1 DUF4392 domain-containing protein [Oceanicoccus sp.]MDG1773500.1 DUF4392 domain-containing protein [Oceanicoccus sp.]